MPHEKIMNQICPVCMQPLSIAPVKQITYRGGEEVAMHAHCAQLLPQCLANPYSEMSAALMARVTHGSGGVIPGGEPERFFAAGELYRLGVETVSLGPSGSPLCMKLTDIQHIGFYFIPRKKGPAPGTVVGDVRAVIRTFSGWTLSENAYEGMTAKYRIKREKGAYRYLNRDFAEFVKTAKKMCGRGPDACQKAYESYEEYISDPSTLDESTAFVLLGFAPWAHPDARAVRKRRSALMQRVHTDHGGSDALMRRVISACDIVSKVSGKEEES